MGKLTNKTLYKATETHMECYAVSLHNKKVKSDTIRNHLTAVNNKFKLKGLQPKTESFRLEKLLTAHEKGEGQKQVRKLITRKLLKRIPETINEVEKSEHNRKPLKSVLTLMYSGLLRVSEVTQSKHGKENHNLKRSNGISSGDVVGEVILTLKTDKFSKKPVTMAVKEIQNITP